MCKRAIVQQIDRDFCINELSDGRQTDRGYTFVYFMLKVFFLMLVMFMGI